ncbi:MAG: helix-turn-helix domain-containing protein [Planctomycetota bacterium]|nr:helix-turn-helix domain-containing protein [Planctomycetota bacterium]MDA1179166.1 helix-turn-helix domain-containing protein [Planctomycetota bacterium]
MSDLIDLEDAARMLGLSPEELVEHRSRGDISGLRSGTSWKFKRTEIERFKESQADLPLEDDFSLSLDDELDAIDLNPTAQSSAKADSADDLSFSLDDDLPELQGDDESAESVLISEHELGRSDDATASTIIGQIDPRLGLDALAGESDLKIGGLEPPVTGQKDAQLSDVELAAASDLLDDGALSLDANASDEMNVKPSSQSGISLSGFGEDEQDDEIDLDVSPPSHASGFSSLRLAGDSSSAKVPAPNTGADRPPSPAKPSKQPAGAAVPPDEERISLDDDDMMLDIGGSDVTLDASASGINLGRPSDSGLSLEDAMLELDAKGDSAFLGDEMLVMEDDKEGSSDDEFLLTPIEGSANFEEEGSGSQVIELEDDFSGSDVDDAVELLEDSEALELDEDSAGLDHVSPLAASGAAPLVATGGEGAESEYTLGSILLLFCLAGIMLVSSLMVSDIMRSMWSFQEPFSVSSSLMEFLTNALPK